MANNPLPVARSKIYIGSVTTTFNQTTVAADSYTQIGGVRTIPPIGDTYQDIAVEEVSDGRTRHAKGTASGASMEIVCSRRSTDAGQIAMAAAADDVDQAYNLKIEIPNGAGGTDTYYLSGLVTGKPIGLGGPNDTQTRTFNFQPNEAPIEVLAS